MFHAGTNKVAVPYTIGNRTSDVTLKVINLDKQEDVSIDAISNQDFSEVIHICCFSTFHRLLNIYSFQFLRFIFSWLIHIKSFYKFTLADLLKVEYKPKHNFILFFQNNIILFLDCGHL